MNGDVLAVGAIESVVQEALRPNCHCDRIDEPELQDSLRVEDEEDQFELGRMPVMPVQRCVHARWRRWRWWRYDWRWRWSQTIGARGTMPVGTIVAIRSRLTPTGARCPNAQRAQQDENEEGDATADGRRVSAHVTADNASTL